MMKRRVPVPVSTGKKRKKEKEKQCKEKGCKKKKGEKKEKNNEKKEKVLEFLICALHLILHLVPLSLFLFLLVGEKKEGLFVRMREKTKRMWFRYWL